MNPISRIAPVTDAEAARMVHPGTLADLAERLTSMPAEAAGGEDAAGSAAWHSPRRRRRLLIAIPAVAAVAVTALLATSLGGVTFRPGSHATRSSPAGPGGSDLYPLGPPRSGVAQKTTVAGAQAKAGFPVPLPSTVAASHANLTYVWVSTRGPGRQVALVFDKGKVDILMHRATYQSDLRSFRAFVAQKKQNGAAAAWIGRVHGQPALVIVTHSNRAVVAFWRNGVDIGIYGNTSAYGTHTLLAIAESMH